jgi:two-component system nitrate/nitrite response regulator NarL
VAFALLDFPNLRRVSPIEGRHSATAPFSDFDRLRLGETLEKASVIRILLAHRLEIYRDGLTRLLQSQQGFVAVGSAGTAPEALQLVRELDPDILLLDLALNNGDGLEVLRTLERTGERVRTIGFVDGAETSVQQAALRHGARVTLRKDSATALLFTSIRTVFHGERWICRDMTGTTVHEPSDAAPQRDVHVPAKRFNLTRREMDVVSAVAAGESNKGIARKLSLSEDTVKHHVSHVFDKLGVFSRLELAVFAFNHDLVRDVIDLSA